VLPHQVCLSRGHFYTCHSEYEYAGAQEQIILSGGASNYRIIMYLGAARG
jgi:hypothetical protein